MARTKTDTQIQEIANTWQPPKPTHGLAFTSRRQESKDPERTPANAGSQRKKPAGCKAGPKDRAHHSVTKHPEARDVLRGHAGV